MPITNYTADVNYTARQLKLPLEIEKNINISDPVYTFCDVMEHIDLSGYFVEEKGYKTGRPRCDAEKIETINNEVLCMLGVKFEAREEYAH